VTLLEKDKDLLASICITSFKRINELKRCLNSIDSKYPSKLEVIISEDHSSLRGQIENMVLEYAKSSKYTINFNSNEVNLGYDRNLEKLISLAKGKYVIFMSDDDCFVENSLDKVLEFLGKEDEPFVYTPFILSNKLVQRKYNNDIKIKKGSSRIVKYLYDAILFSGLIFKHELVHNISAERFVNLNYFQIYLALYMFYNYGGYYLNVPMVNCIGDGENAYGHTELSQKNKLLADRSSIYSNLEFHKGLIKVIKIFDADFQTEIFRGFQKEYSLRIYQGMSTARKTSRNDLSRYWEKLQSLDIKLTPIAIVYFGLLIVFGSTICDTLFFIPKKCLLFLRKRKRG